jgi:hypothetical protein
MMETLICFSQWLDEIILRTTVASYDFPFDRGLNATMARWDVNDVTPFFQLPDRMYHML